MSDTGKLGPVLMDCLKAAGKRIQQRKEGKPNSWPAAQPQKKQHQTHEEFDSVSMAAVMLKLMTCDPCDFFPPPAGHARGPSLADADVIPSCGDGLVGRSGEGGTQRMQEDFEGPRLQAGAWEQQDQKKQKLLLDDAKWLVTNLMPTICAALAGFESNPGAALGAEEALSDLLALPCPLFPSDSYVSQVVPRLLALMLQGLPHPEQQVLADIWSHQLTPPTSNEEQLKQWANHVRPVLAVMKGLIPSSPIFMALARAQVAVTEQQL
eukprot:gene3230-13253_t